MIYNCVFTSLDGSVVLLRKTISGEEGDFPIIPDLVYWANKCCRRVDKLQIYEISSPAYSTLVKLEKNKDGMFVDEEDCPWRDCPGGCNGRRHNICDIERGIVLEADMHNTASEPSPTIQL